MVEPLDLAPYIEQLTLVPDRAICTIDVAILRAFVSRAEKAEAALRATEKALTAADGMCANCWHGDEAYGIVSAALDGTE